MNRSTRRVLLVRRLNRVSSLTPTPMGSSITPTAVAAVNPPNNRQQQPPPRLSAATALLHPRRHENCSHGSNSSSSRSFSVARLFCQSPCADTPWTRNHPGHHHHQQSQQLRHLTPKRRPLSFSSSSSPPSPLAPPAATSPFREDASVLQPTANTPAAATSEDSLCAAMQSWEDPTTTTIIVQQQQQQRAPSTDATTTTASTGTNTSSNNDAQLILNEHEKNDWIQQFHSGIQLLQTFLTARDGRNQMAPSSELHPPATVGSRSPTTPATGHREPPGGAELRAALDLYGRILRGTFYAATHVTTTNANCNSNSNSSNNNTNNNNNNFFGTCEWMGEARHLLNPLVYHWHGAWLLSSKRDDNRKSTLLQPLELIQSLYTLSHQIPFFRYDIATIGMIVKVVSRYPPRAPMYRDRSRGGLILSRYWPKQEEQQQMQRQLPQQQYQARQAAMAAQALLEFAADQSQKLDCPRLRPDVVTYSQVIAAWTAAAPFSNIKSITIARDDDEIPRRLQALVKDMYDRFGLVPNPIIYTTLLRFWAERGSVQQVEQLLDDMATHGVEPTLSCLAQALYCYAKASEAFMAEGLLDVMIEQHLALRQPQQSHVEHDNSLPSATDAKASNLKIDRQHVKGSDARSVKLIVAGAIKVMDMYRQNLVKGNKVDSARNDQILSSAEALLQKLVLTELLTPNSHDKLKGTLLDCYAIAGQQEKAEMIFKELDSPGIFQYRAMIKAYGNSDQADLALGVLNTMLAEDRVFPDASVFTTLINALCESTRSDAVDQAWAVLQLMDQNPKCIQLGIKPDTFAYNTFLKGLVTSKVTADYSNHCIKAVSVLDEMERRFQTIGEGQSVRAIPFSYNLALKVCMRACDLDQADAVLSRMEDRLQNPPPNIATYTDILLMYAALRTAEAAERAERIFLRVLALPKKANDPQLTPSVFLYGAAINAWTQSNDEQAPERVLKIYQQLCLDSSLEANTSLYADLIACLSKSTKSDVEKADEFLKVMEGKSSNKHTVGSIDVAPDRRHYGSVMNGWISHGEAERAADVLIRRMTAFVNGEAPRAQPTADNFYLVTNTFIRSDQLVQATEFIQHVQEWVIAGHLSEGPDLHTFVALQSAWERSSENNASNHAMWIESKIASWSQ